MKYTTSNAFLSNVYSRVSEYNKKFPKVRLIMWLLQNKRKENIQTEKCER